MTVVPEARFPLRRIMGRIARVALAVLLGSHSTAHAAASGHSQGPPGHGRLLPLLSDGTPIEPSTYRAESTEDPECLEGGQWDWGVDLVSGSMDRLDGLRSRSLECMNLEARRGLGHGLQIGARAESWSQEQVQQGALAQSVRASGIGPTTLTALQRLSGDGPTGPRVAAGVRLRLPGSSGGPGTSVAEGGVFVPVAFPLGESTRLGTMIDADVVHDALDSGRHLEGVSSLELSHDVAERVSVRVEAVSVWYGETGRPWLGVLDAGFSVEPAPHVGITAGASGGLSGPTTDLGWFGRLSVHP